jgi:hypothetical protein
MASDDGRAARERAQEIHADLLNLVWLLVEAKLLKLTLAGVVFDSILALVSDDEGATHRFKAGATSAELTFGSTSSEGLGGRDIQQPDDLRRTVGALREWLVETGYIKNRHQDDTRTASALQWIQQARLGQEEVELQRRFSSAVTALLEAGKALAAPGPKDPSLLPALGKAIADLLSLSAARLRLDAARAAKAEAEPIVPATVRVEPGPIVAATPRMETGPVVAATPVQDADQGVSRQEVVTGVVMSTPVNDGALEKADEVVVGWRWASVGEDIGEPYRPGEAWGPGISPAGR